MNRKLVLTLAVSGALAGLTGGVSAQEAPKPEGEQPQLQQLAPQLEMALPWYLTEGDEDKKPEQPQARWILAEGDEDKKPEQPQAQLILAEGDEEKKPDSQLILSEGDEEKKPEQQLI